MSVPVVLPLRCPRVLARLRIDTEGATAVEFGLLGGVFVLCIAFAIEIGLDLFMQGTLDQAVRRESRLIRTGAITTSNAAQFRTNLCNDISFLMNCSNIQINVTSGNTFSALTSAIPTDSSNHMTTTGFNAGGSGQNVLVQVGYYRSLFFPRTAGVLGKAGTVLITSSTAFQNEPF